MTDAQVFPIGYQRLDVSKQLPSHEELNRAPRWVRTRLHKWILELPKNATVLDVGCGSGKAARVIRALRPDIHLHGIDTTDVTKALPNGVTFTHGSGETLREYFDASSFDGVICQHLIEHLVYPIQLIEGIDAVLKPGGSLYLETPNWTRIFVPFTHVWFWNDYTHVRPFSKMAMHRLMSESGFVVDLLETHSSNRWLPPWPAKTPNGAQSKSSTPHFRFGIIARIVSRLVTPLLKDVLVVVASKPNVPGE